MWMRRLDKTWETATLEIMTDTQRKWLAVIASVAALVLIGSQFLFGASPIPSATPLVAYTAVPLSGTTSTQPKITWSTTSINIILSPGESTSSDLTFTSSQKLTNVALTVVPQIAPFVNVQPSSISSLAANQAQSVHLAIAIAAATAFGTYDGTIQLKSGTTTFPQTVKVVVNVWPTFTSTIGFTLHYPPSFFPVQSTDPNSSEVGFYSSPQVFSEGISPTFTATKSQLPNGLSLRDWVKSFGVDDAGIDQLALGGKLFIKWSELGTQDFAPISYSISADQVTVITVTASSHDFGESMQFPMIVSSLTIQ